MELVLSRQQGESVTIGNQIVVKVIEIRGDKVRLGFVAPKELGIHRTEVYQAIRSEEDPLTRMFGPQSLRSSVADDLRQRQARLAAQANQAKAPPPDVKLRPATEADLVAINDVYNHYVACSTCTYQEEPESIESRREWFARREVQHPVTVATIDGKVAGWGSLSAYHSRSAYRHTVENSVYVHHEFQRRGIGSAILEDLIERGRLLGHRAIIAGIDGEQPASIQLHSKFGFEQVGHMKQVGFKFGRWLDVIYLQLIL